MAKKNVALDAEEQYKSDVQRTTEYVERFDILETINNVGNDEVFTPRKVVDMMLDSLPEDVWHNPDYKWLNPASKTGIFEREIAIRLDEGLKDIIPDTETRRKHILQEMIFSIGQTKFTANVARRTLYYCCQANRKCDGIKEDGHYVNGYAIGEGTWFDDAEGNIKTPCSNHLMNKNKCVFCGMSKDSKYLDINQREKYSYDFIHVNSGNDLKKYLSKRFFKGDEKVKFDIIVGNPPYQINDEGNGSSAMPIYQKFVTQSISLNPRYISMIIPARWYAGGKGLEEFRSMMLSNNSIRTLVDFVNAKDCFPSLSISGGVCYFLIDNSYHGLCEYVSHNRGTTSRSYRSLNEYDIFVRFNQALSIIEKIKTLKEGTVDNLIVSRNPFGLPTSYKGSDVSDEKNSIAVKTSAGIRYCSNSDITQGKSMIPCYKVIISRSTAEHAGEPDKEGTFGVISTCCILKPGEVCSDSYLVLYVCDLESEANHYLSYLKTRFYRFLLLQAISSISISKDKFQFIPIQDFSCEYSDESLNIKYGLSTEEIIFINSLIKEKV